MKQTLSPPPVLPRALLRLGGVCCFIGALLAFAPACAWPQFPPTKVLSTADFAGGVPAVAQSFAGQWQPTDGYLRQTQLAGASLMVIAKPEWNAPYTAKVRVRVATAAVGAEAGLVLQLRDVKNYVVFSLQRRKSGAFAVLRIQADPGMSIVTDQAPVQLDPAEWHELRAEVFGPHFSCYVDGKPAVNYSFLGTPPPAQAEYKVWLDPAHGDAGVMTSGAAADFDDFEVSRQASYAHMVTPRLPRRDFEGRLLPRQSFAETIRRNTEWMIESPQIVDRSALPKFQDVEPYVISNWVTTDDKLTGLGAGEFAFNHASFILCALRYYVFSGDQRALDMARKIADWEIANSTTADYAAPFLPPTFVAWQNDGTWKGMEWGLEPDKAAYLGLSFLKLAAATGEQKYQAAALRMAGTLKKLQQPDGSMPFRVDARTAVVKSKYTESQLWHIQFFERVAAITRERSFLVARDRALRWFLDNPVRTNGWLGLYGDVDSSAKSYDQWIPMETIIYLLEHRAENPEYFKKALGILDWLNRTLVINPGFHEGVPGVMEQSGTPWVDSFVELRLGVTYARLWEVTGDERYRDLAVKIGNSVTYCLMSDGKMRLGFYYTSQEAPIIPITNEEYCDIMASIPQTAPRNENHILRTSGDVRTVAYTRSSIAYSTVGASEDVLVVAGPVASVRAGGKPLTRWPNAQAAGDGWFWDSRTSALRLRHGSPDVVVVVEAPASAK